MNNIKQLFFSLVFIAISIPAIAEPASPPIVDDGGLRGFVEKHNAIESMSLRISMDETLHGFIEGKVCDFCEKIKVTITPETKAYQNDVEVPLKQARGRLGRYATVIYELETKNVSAIRW